MPIQVGPPEQHSGPAEGRRFTVLAPHLQVNDARTDAKAGLLWRLELFQAFTSIWAALALPPIATVAASARTEVFSFEILNIANSLLCMPGPFRR